MAQYEFQLIAGDGSQLRREMYSLADPRTAWDHVFLMADKSAPPGSKVRVFDDRGGVVIGVGVATATALARMRNRGLPSAPTL
jgi:hypothetical protein